MDWWEWLFLVIIILILSRAKITVVYQKCSANGFCAD